MIKRKLVQIRQSFSNFNHAGSKAPDDVTEIASRMGFKLLAIKRLHADGLLTNIVSCALWIISIPVYGFRVPRHAIVLLQYPELYFSGPLSILLIKFIRKFRDAKTITLVHDIDELRRDDVSEREFDQTKTKWMMNLTDVFIVHNEPMKNWMMSKGIASTRLVILGAFDYLIKGNVPPLPTFSHNIVFAGNLSRKNTSFIYDAIKIPGIKWDLFGPNFDGEATPSATYHGVYSPDELPARLSAGFGLVWNGDSIETCNGETGRYLRYNYPHKLSLYIAAGLPIIIWDQAAEADLVKQLGIGIATPSIKSVQALISRISPDEYLSMQVRINEIRQKIINGKHTNDSLAHILNNRISQ